MTHSMSCPFTWVLTSGLYVPRAQVKVISLLDMHFLSRLTTCTVVGFSPHSTNSQVICTEAGFAKGAKEHNGRVKSFLFLFQAWGSPERTCKIGLTSAFILCPLVPDLGPGFWYHPEHPHSNIPLRWPPPPQHYLLLNSSFLPPIKTTFPKWADHS